MQASTFPVLSVCHYDSGFFDKESYTFLLQALLTQGQTGKSLQTLNVSGCPGMDLASLDLGRTVSIPASLLIAHTVACGSYMPYFRKDLPVSCCQIQDSPMLQVVLEFLCKK